jgi:quercetin dioxygenase-like cupin family protein
MTETEFEILAADRGHGDLTVKEFAPDVAPPLHPHDWSTLLLVTQGSLTLAFEDREVALVPGDWCAVGPGELHSEQTGAEGAVAILATRRTD